MTNILGNSEYLQRAPYELNLTKKIAFLKKNEKWIKVSSLCLSGILVIIIIFLTILYEEYKTFIVQLMTKNEFLDLDKLFTILIIDTLLNIFALFGFVSYVHYQKDVYYNLWKFGLMQN